MADPKKSSGKRYSLWSGFFLFNWLYTWIFPVAYQSLGKKKAGLHFRLRNQESARLNGDMLQAAWQKELEVRKEKASILKALTSVFGVEYGIIGLYKIAWGAFTWLCAYYFLKQILVFLRNFNSNPDRYPGHMYAVALLLSALFSSFAIHQLYGECNRMGIKVKSALNVLIYRKSLKLSRIRGGAGEVINIMSTDVTRINDCVVNFHFLWSAFLEAALIVALAFYEIGISAFPALGFVLLLLPLQMYLGKLTSTYNREQTILTTERVHIMSEILTAIKLIKFYAWEKPFAEKIEEIREKELGILKKGMIVKSINFMVVFSVPVFIALASLGMYVALGNTLTAPISFTVLSIYNTLRYPFFMLPMAVRSYAGALTAFGRLNKFLLSEEVEELKQSEMGPDGYVLNIDKADFRWDGADTEKPTLTNVNLKVKPGQKIAVIGDVGSGKSSLIAAILGQIRQVGGAPIRVCGTVSYVPQQAWLLNQTLRDNILFGLQYEKRRYKEVIRVCSLQRDLTLLVAGDQTELAERGANLSGGQRQRTSLARAVYHNTDIVLLDDPISAVDQHVGRHIFEECFMKFLKPKTVIVAMHQLQYLPQMDWVVVMKNGKIDMQGTYDELMTKSESFADLISSHVASGEQNDEDDEPEIINDKEFEIPENSSQNHQQTPLERSFATVRSMKEVTTNRLTSIIERNQLSIQNSGTANSVAQAIQQNQLSVYSTSDANFENIDDKEEEEDYANAEKGRLVMEDTSASRTGFQDVKAYFTVATGSLTTSMICLFFFVVHGVRIGSDYWLRVWVPKSGKSKADDAFYLGIYGMLTAVFAVGVLLRGLAFTFISYNKSIQLHKDIFNSVIRAPMSFFDMTPLGRILSAFSKHLLHLDDTMPDAFLQMLQYLPLGLGALLLSAALIPWNWAPCLCLVIIGYGFVKFSNPAITKTKAMEAITKAPVFAHTTTSLEGLFSIRAFHAQIRFDNLNLQKLDENHEALFALNSCKSFQALYLDVISSFVVYFTALLIVIFAQVNEMDAIAGLALSNALQMLVFVQWTVRMWGDVNAQMSSVGQVVYYSDIESEAPAEITETKPAANWPPHGRIDFENIVLRYHKFGVDVLKNINFTIHPCEKIGIVGRTGSGKSTLLVSLLRIVEAAQGKIRIDGIDVSTLGLTDLRSKIAIIPQEPVLFVGTVRTNLDPFSKSTDDELWKALDAVNLAQTIRNMPDKLDSQVIENGSNFSLGQRQLFCIARAILAKTKVLVLDEATAAIDMATDLFIQNAIKKAFADLTVLTIAHRLNTIIESDRVLVMDAGQVQEFDEPIKLLDKPDGSFRKLVEQTGEATAQKLREIAEQSAEERRRKKKGIYGNHAKEVSISVGDSKQEHSKEL